MESVAHVAPGARLARRSIYIATTVLALASCAAMVHYGVRLSDWRGSVAAAHRGVHDPDREQQMRAVVVLLKSALDTVESLRVASESPDADVRHRAVSALQHIAETSK